MPSPVTWPPRLLWVQDGTFLLGHSNQSVSPVTYLVDGEGPARSVRISSFWLGETEVSNAQWATFSHATGYVTDAERIGTSSVFVEQLPSASLKEVPGENHTLPKLPRSSPDTLKLNALVISSCFTRDHPKRSQRAVSDTTATLAATQLSAVANPYCGCATGARGLAVG